MAFFGKVKAVANVLYSPKYLLITNAFIGSTCVGLGDFVVQKFSVNVTKEQNKIEVKKVATAAFIGGSFSFVETFYYRWLERVLPGVSMAGVARKVIMDQIFISIPYDTYFFTASRTVETGSLKEGIEYTKQILPTAYLADCLYWPLLQAINFRFVPAKYRVTYNASVTLLWNVFLCYLHLQMKKRNVQHSRPAPSVPHIYPSAKVPQINPSATVPFDPLVTAPQLL